MKTKEITLCGKQVTLAYCYATEIGYKFLADEDISDFTREALECIKQNVMPDIKKTILFVGASITSYYDSLPKEDNVKAPINDGDLMYKCSPEDIGLALGTVLALRAEFYGIPASEAKEQEQNQKESNSKND